MINNEYEINNLIKKKKRKRDLKSIWTIHKKMYLIQELQQFHKNVFALGIAISLSEIRDMINNEHEINNFSSKFNL